MTHFLLGLGFGLLFLLAWLLLSAFGGLIEGLSGQRPMPLYIAVIVTGVGMFAAPLYFWIIAPITCRLRARKSH